MKDDYVSEEEGLESTLKYLELVKNWSDLIIDKSRLSRNLGGIVEDHCVIIRYYQAPDENYKIQVAFTRTDPSEEWKTYRLNIPGVYEYVEEYPGGKIRELYEKIASEKEESEEGILKKEAEADDIGQRRFL